MKKVLIGLVVLIAIIGGGLFYVLSNLDSLVKTAVEEGGSRVTGVAVTLDDVALELTDGKAALNGFMVGNPDGFNTDYAVSLGGVSVDIDIDTIGTDTIVIKSVRIDAPKVIYELAGTSSNIDAIQSHVESFTGGSSSSSSSSDTASDSEGPKIIIEDLVIAGGEVAVSAGFLAGKALSTPLPEIHLTDIGKEEDGSGSSSADVAAEIMAALNDQIIGSVGQLDLSGMMDGAGEALQGATEAAGAIGGEAGSAAGEAMEGAGEAVGGALNSLLGNSN